MRKIVIGRVRSETALESFRSDFEWISWVRRAAAAGKEAGGEAAALRVWRPSESRLSAGRFHRIADGASGIVRRMSGGRTVAAGSGTLALSLVAPSIAWFDPSVERLKPEQVINRAVRPLLAALRTFRLDPIYPGRDVVTLARRPAAYVSYTTLPDGVALVEMLVSLTDDFRATPELLAARDPDAVAAVSPDAFADAVSLAEHADVSEIADDSRWREALAEACTATFRARADLDTEVPQASMRAGENAWRAFQAERGAPAPGTAYAAGVTQLGVVEAEALSADGRLHGVRICGDLIAPFRTVDGIGVELEGVAIDRPCIEAAIASVLSRPGQFLLGGADLGEIVSRIA